MNKRANDPDHYTEDEAARRRDEVIRRMANTPPQPKAKTPHHPKTKKKAGAVRKARAARGSSTET